MAISGRALRAGKAVIELSLLTGNVEKGLKKVERRMRDFGKGLSSIGSTAMKVSAAVGAPFLVAIKAASDAQETLSRFKAVFGEQTVAATQFADSLAKEVGRAATDIKNGMASFQAFFVGLGFSAEKSRELSQQLSRLSLDFASFNNLADDDAQRRFISALSGSSEVLDMYGINIKVAALDQELLNMGFKGGALAANEQQKSLARLNIIMQSMTSQGAVGDAVRTSGSFANMLKRVQGEMKTLSERIGVDVLPMATDFLAKVIDIVNKLGEWHSRNRELVTSLAELAAFGVLGGGGLVAIGSVIEGIGSIMAGVVIGAKALGIALMALYAHPIVAGLAGLALALSYIALQCRDVNKEADRLAKTLDRIGKNKSVEGGVMGAFVDALEKAFGAGVSIGPERQYTHRPVPNLAVPSMGGGGAAAAGGKSGGGGFNVPNTSDILRINRLLIDRARAATSGGLIAAGMEAWKAQAQMQVQRVAEAQRIEDEIAHAKIAAIKDNAERERALIQHEHNARLRALQDGGMLDAEMQARLDELRDVQLDTAARTAGVGAGSRVPEAVFDTRFASQIFGDGDEEREQTKVLQRVEGHLRHIANRPEGIPIIFG